MRSLGESCLTRGATGRNGLDVSDGNKAYCEYGTMTYDTLPRWWTDAGTFESLRLANDLAAGTN